MEYLESFDLSRNNLSGEIPQSIAKLTFLSVLNLSDNNLSGRIPSGTQIQTFSPLSFFGDEEETQQPTGEGENRDCPEIAWFYVGIGLGFFVGLWGVCGCLFFNKAWRHAYFNREKVSLFRLWN